MNSTVTLWICQVGRDGITFSEVSQYFWGEKSLHITQGNDKYEFPTDNILYIKVTEESVTDDSDKCCP